MKTPAHHTIASLFNMDSIPGEYEALGLVVLFSQTLFIYLFIHYYL